MYSIVKIIFIYIQYNRTETEKKLGDTIFLQRILCLSKEKIRSLVKDKLFVE